MNDKKRLLKEKYAGKKTKAYHEDCKRLEAGEPLAYLIGHIPFLDTTIYLDSKPLIPRPETEFWTLKAIEEIKGRTPQNMQILDLCAGSGCIGISVLLALPDATVDFVEVDEMHHSTIHKNLIENNIDFNRASVLGGNLFQFVSKQYNFILANPPYIDPLHDDRVETSVKKYEPERALYGGRDGTEYIREILIGSPEHLTKEGVLFLEHEPEQAVFISTMSKDLNLAAVSLKDQYNVCRFTRVTRLKT